MVKITSTCPTIRSSAAGAAAKPVYQQAEPSAESSPTCAELRQDRPTARSVPRSRATIHARCRTLWIVMTTTNETSADPTVRSEEHTSELQSLMRNSYAVFCLKKKHKK